MVFSSLVFLFAFLVPHLVVYFFAPERYRNPVLLVSSLIFYSWGGPEYLVLLLGVTAASWFFALRIEACGACSHRKLYIVGECAALLGVLGVFKYTRLVLGTTHALFGVPELVPQIVLPLGISFYTFQLISYVVDVYRGNIAAQPRYWKLLLYSSLFHQCIAGPIVRYETVADQIDARRITTTDVYYGIRRFSIGLAKKALLANSCAAAADALLPLGTSGMFTQVAAGYWLGMLFYMLQIYLDFSAYSDMAIGMGRMVGFRYLENFNYPYMARSVQDFWRRWHISLSSFFRDYLYIPLGGSRVPKVVYVRNMAIVWFLTGLWHGASYNYILWGLYFLAFLLLERFVIGDYLKGAWAHVYTLAVVYFGWVLFKFEDFGELLAVLGGMFGASGAGLANMAVQTVFLQHVFLIAVCVLACTNVGKRIHYALYRQSERGGVWLAFYNLTEVLTPALLLFVAVAALAGASYNPFIYFHF